MDKEKEIILGVRPLIEAIDAGQAIDKVLIQRNTGGKLIQEIKHLAKLNDIPLQVVPIQKLNKITRKNHQGVIGLTAPISFHSIDQLLPSVYEKGKTPLLLILDKITDIRNFGAITRSAECAGADAIIIPFKSAARVGDDAIKTSAGALFKVPVCREKSLTETVNYLKDSGIQVVACTEKAAKPIFEIDLKVPTAIIMGAEEQGISPEMVRIADQQGKIPVLGEIESLNVSVAAGIALYEAVKQRLTGS